MTAKTNKIKSTHKTAEQLTEQTNNSRPWLYKKGQSGNPKGRPKGTFSLKEYLKKKFNNMTDEEREEYLEGIDKKTIWEMAEGKAQQHTDLTTNGEAIQPILVKFIDENDRNT
jgi:hypothetical protein